MVKVFKNGPRKICGRQPLKNLKGYGGSIRGSHIPKKQLLCLSTPYPSNILYPFLKAVFLTLYFGPFLNSFSHTGFTFSQGRGMFKVFGEKNITLYTLV